MLIQRMSRTTALCLSLAAAGSGLPASETGESAAAALASLADGGAGPVAETKAPSRARTSTREERKTGTAPIPGMETKAAVREPIGSSGLYALEGVGQGDPIEWVLGMRADRTPVNPELQALEAHPVTRAKCEDVDFAYTKHTAGKATQQDAGAGFGSNVCYDSPLIQHIRNDIQSGRFGSEARPLFLDVGAGVGYNTRALVEMGADVVANDQSLEQLAILRRYLGGFDDWGSHIYLNDGDIFALDIPGGTFDGILASHLFHYLRPGELETLVARFRRWLKPGGRLYIQCWNINMGCFKPFRPIWETNKEAGKPWPGSIEKAREVLRSLEGDGAVEEFAEGFGDYVHAIEPEDLARLVEASGFTRIKDQVDDFPTTDAQWQKEVYPACQVMLIAQADAASPAAGDGDGEEIRVIARPVRKATSIPALD